MKKGISIWIWLSASVIIGLLFVVFLRDTLSRISNIKTYEESIKNYNILFSELNDACHSEIGYKKRLEYLVYQPVNFISIKDYNVPFNYWVYGNTICINTTQDYICNNLECNLNMTVFGYIPPEKDPFSKYREMKGENYVCYNLFISKIGYNNISLCACRCEEKNCQCDNE